MFLAQMGSGRWEYGSLCLLMHPQSRQLIEAPQLMRAWVMTSLLKVFLRTDKVMWSDFDLFSAIITLLTNSEVLWIRGGLLFKNTG